MFSGFTTYVITSDEVKNMKTESNKGKSDVVADRPGWEWHISHG